MEPPKAGEITARLRVLLDAATTGPWEYRLNGPQPIVGGDGGAVVTGDISNDDAALVVDAINALPVLLDAVDALDEVSRSLDIRLGPGPGVEGEVFVIPIYPGGAALWERIDDILARLKE